MAKIRQTMRANVHGACVRAATRDTAEGRAISSEPGGPQTKTEVSNVKVVTPGVAECTAHSAVKSNETKRIGHSNPDVAKCIAQSAPRPNGAKSTVQSIHEHAEATAKQQRVQDPRHWLQVPVNNFTEGECWNH